MANELCRYTYLYYLLALCDAQRSEKRMIVLPSHSRTPVPHLLENLNIHSTDVSPPSADSRSEGLEEGSWEERS
jgi:hypothetical protein